MDELFLPQHMLPQDVGQLLQATAPPVLIVQRDA